MLLRSTTCYSDFIVTIMLKHAGTKQRIDRTTNLSRLIMFGNLRIDLFVWCGEKYMVVNQVNPKCGFLVECVGNRHDNIDPSFYSVKV